MDLYESTRDTNRRAPTAFKPPMWTQDEALKLIHELQSRVWSLGYHIALGGGVLNHGTSYNDLDLYFLPFSDRSKCNENGLDTLLIDRLGAPYPLGHKLDDERLFNNDTLAPYEVPEGETPFYRTRATFYPCRNFDEVGTRIDVFIG